ncbi:hypothetical protein [Streptomyces rubradiris]|uniref:Uncharacterized protein n=1 Tax=Streptomyces rubradiris TaxID=285531 RepID=A0ABQ3RQW5_STRRR|nr:hypothetical protein [Streptomyces rubradiris]GHH24787.1 hypothetical protein GCM10018792_62800 [Streptomyces rubradiris]GHI58239.1 hypothetical protein Srubr_80850 [Streptomyces rubradiris]
MNDRPAAEQLVRALKELKQKAGCPSYAAIAAWGQQQIPAVNLGKSKLSAWFNGISVPTSGRPFTVLVELLEARAQQKSGTPKRGLPAWQAMRKAADNEQRRAGFGSSAPSSDVRIGETDPVVRLVTQAGEFMREADRVFDAVARYELSPRRAYPTKTVTTADGWSFDVPVGPVPADPKDVEALAEVDRALVGVRADAERTATLMPGLESHVRRVLAACTDVRRSCVRIDHDDDGRPDSSYPKDLLNLREALNEVKAVAAALRRSA